MLGCPRPLGRVRRRFEQRGEPSGRLARRGSQEAHGGTGAARPHPAAQLRVEIRHLPPAPGYSHGLAAERPRVSGMGEVGEKVLVRRLPLPVWRAPLRRPDQMSVARLMRSRPTLPLGLRTYVTTLIKLDAVN